MLRTAARPSGSMCPALWAWWPRAIRPSPSPTPPTARASPHCRPTRGPIRRPPSPCARTPSSMCRDRGERSRSSSTTARARPVQRQRPPQPRYPTGTWPTNAAGLTPHACQTSVPVGRSGRTVAQAAIRASVPSLPTAPLRGGRASPGQRASLLARRELPSLYCVHAESRPGHLVVGKGRVGHRDCHQGIGAFRGSAHGFDREPPRKPSLRSSPPTPRHYEPFASPEKDCQLTSRGRTA